VRWPATSLKWLPPIAGTRRGAAARTRPQGRARRGSPSIPVHSEHALKVTSRSRGCSLARDCPHRRYRAATMLRFGGNHIHPAAAAVRQLCTPQKVAALDSGTPDLMRPPPTSAASRISARHFGAGVSLGRSCSRRDLMSTVGASACRARCRACCRRRRVGGLCHRSGIFVFRPPSPLAARARPDHRLWVLGGIIALWQVHSPSLSWRRRCRAPGASSLAAGERRSPPPPCRLLFGWTRAVVIRAARWAPSRPSSRSTGIISCR